MMETRLAIVFVVFVGGFFTSVADAEDIGAILATTSGDTHIGLTEDSFADNIVVSSRAVTITSGNNEGRLITNSSAAPLFSVLDGGHLTLDLISLQSRDDQPSDTLIYVENATLTLNNCVLTTQRRFSVYMRGGVLQTSNCDFLDSDTAVAVTEGAQGTLTGARFNNPVSGGLWVTGLGSYAAVSESEFAFGARGISVDDGAQLLLESSGVYSSSEVGIFSDASGVRLRNVSFESIEGFAFYAQNQSGVAIEDGSIVGPIDTGLMLINSTIEVAGLEIVDAQTGINVNGGNTPVSLREVVSVTTMENAVHVIAEGHSIDIRNSIFEGGSTGVGVISGALNLEDSLVAGQTSTSVQVNGGDGVGPVVIKNVALVPEFEGLAIHGNTSFELKGSQVVYEGSALGGDGLIEADISNNLLFGPGDGTMMVQDGPRDIKFANDFRFAENHRDIWQAVVSSADADSRLLALEAVETAFSRQSGDAEMSILSLFDREIGAALQHADWLELGSLMRIEEGMDPLWLGDIRIDDLPINLLPGQYMLEGFGRVVSIDLNEPGSEHWLEMPVEAGPYALYRVEGSPRRGPTFNLRPQIQLVQIMEGRWPGYTKYNPPSVAKFGATAKERADALEAARIDVRASLAFMDSLPKGAIYDDINREQRSEIADHVYQKSALARRVLAAHGQSEDATWLLDIAQPHLGLAAEFWAREIVKTAAEIEARLGILSTGAAARLLNQIGTDYENPAFPSLAVAMATFGHAGAIEQLVDAVAVERVTEDWYTTDAFQAFSLVMHENVPEVTELALEFVDSYQAQVLLSMTEGAKPKAHHYGLNVFSVIYPAYLHASAYATGDDRQRLSVGIPQWNQMSQLGPLLTQPSELFEHIVAMDGPDLRALRNSELAFMTCDLLMGQPMPQKAYRAVENAMTSYGARYPDSIQLPQLWASNIASSGATNCLALSQSMNNLETPDNREPSWLSHAWNYAFYPPSQAIADVAAASDSAIPNIQDFDSTPAFVREPTLASATQTTGLARYKSYSSVATTAHTSKNGPFANGADMRVFLQPVEPFFEGYQLYWVAGTAKLVPIDLDDQTLFGLSLKVDGATFGGLAATIARHPDVLAVNLENRGLAMVQDMVLRHGDGQQTQMTYMRTLDSGVHVYGLPQTPKDQSSLVVDVHFATKGTEGQVMREWVISWPLHHSPYGFNKMRDAGRVTVNGADR